MTGHTAFWSIAKLASVSLWHQDWTRWYVDIDVHGCTYTSQLDVRVIAVHLYTAVNNNPFPLGKNSESNVENGISLYYRKAVGVWCCSNLLVSKPWNGNVTKTWIPDKEYREPSDNIHRANECPKNVQEGFHVLLHRGIGPGSMNLIRYLRTMFDNV